MKTFGLTALALALALALTGCGRKNLPVAPQGVTTPIGQSATPNSDNNPASTANFQNASRIEADANDLNNNDLDVAPTEISRNAGAKKKSFFLDFLLN